MRIWCATALAALSMACPKHAPVTGSDAGFDAGPADVDGSVTAVNIGPDGGPTDAQSAQSSDGKIAIAVPAGGAAAGVTVSIGGSGGHAPPGAVGSSFTLLPEGAFFAQPATLTIKVDAVATESLGTLGVAYRDAQGGWHAIRGAKVDASARTISVPIRHFSEWALFQDLLLEPDHAAVLTGGQQEIDVQMLVPPGALAGEGEVDLPTGTIPYDFSVPVTWEIIGSTADGTVIATGGATINDANYIASPKVPPDNPVQVRARFDPPGGGEYSLVSHITVVARQWNFTAEFKEHHVCDSNGAGTLYDIDSSVTMSFTLDDSFKVVPGAAAVGPPTSVTNLAACNPPNNPYPWTFDNPVADPETMTDLQGSYDPEADALTITSMEGTYVDFPGHDWHSAISNTTSAESQEQWKYLPQFIGPLVFKSPMAGATLNYDGPIPVGTGGPILTVAHQ